MMQQFFNAQFRFCRKLFHGLIARCLFACAVALLAHYLAFFLQMRPALYVALIALSPLNPLLERFAIQRTK